MLEFCPPNITFGNIWVNHGFTDCFMETVSTSIAFGIIVIFGTIEWLFYQKYGTPVVAYSRPKSVLFYTQISLMVILPAIYLTKFCIEGTLIGDKVVYGYMVLTLLFTFGMWLFSLCLVLLERNCMLPSTPTRGHGIVLLLFWTLMFVKENMELLNLKKRDSWFDFSNVKDQVEFAFYVLTYTCTLLVFLLGLKAPGIPSIRDYYSDRNIDLDAEEREPFLPNGTTFRVREGSTFQNMWYKIKTLFPYMWPKKSIFLQLSVIACMLLLVLGRVVNVFVPIYYKKIVDSMTPLTTHGPLTFQWGYVLVYVGLKFLQGGAAGGTGFFNNVRSFLWIKVQQYTTREIQVKFFAHLHGLSLRWHLGRKTGEVLSVMDRGTNSINSLLSYIVFNIVPTVADIIIAVIYFITAFNAWFGLIIFVTMTLYLVATIVVTEWRTKYRRSMNSTDNEQRAKSVDSLLNFETVKYYGAEAYEINRYQEAILKYQKEEFKSTASLNILNTVQNIIINGGLLVGSLLCVHLVVSYEGLTVGDYVLFATYIMQLYAPLNWFGTYYRMIQQSFIDMENMLDLFSEKQDVKDFPNSKSLIIKSGLIEFKNVDFFYAPERPILKNISFTVPPGHTYALVGPSGAGKSTIIRLLFRFYDVQGGEILLDNQNIKYVTQASVRQAIGVVPQDTVLFNETIAYNIHYGRVEGASEEEMIEASKYAEIHDKILTFPDGYDTKVGERGLKISGGEKQRVAIARTLLKSPTFVLLDEATSALDTQTERHIQAALNFVCANKTTVVVAHRLSTIVNADQILVLKDGEIAERGTHDELINDNGLYASMWEQQQKNDTEEKSDKTEDTVELRVRFKEEPEIRHH